MLETNDLAPREQPHVAWLLGLAAGTVLLLSVTACNTVEGAPVAFPSNGPSYDSVYASSDPLLFSRVSNVPLPLVESVGTSS